MKNIGYFFDKHADKWDSYQQDFDYERIEKIIKQAGFSEADIVLDIGAGTGILYDYMMKWKVKNYTAVDISKKMCEVFKSKYPQANVLNLDYESLKSIQSNNIADSKHSKIIIFNTFPHFVNYGKVFDISWKLLLNKGKLIIAHSMNREDLNEHHRNAGREVKNDILISDEKFKLLYKNSGFSDIIVNNDEYFYSEGTKYEHK